MEQLQEFNQQLDTRQEVSERVAGVKVDVLRIHQMGGCLFLWMSVKEKDVPLISNTRFTFKGKLVYESDTSNTLERVLITDLLYGARGEEKSIFKRA